MFKNYKVRLFVIIFGTSLITYILSLLHIIQGFGNNILIAIFILLISLFISIRESYLLSRPLEDLNNGVKMILNKEYNFKINIDYSNEFKEISKNFNEMSSKLYNTYEDLKNRSDELVKKNNELQDFNAELEASYEQLEALNDELEKSESKYRTLVDNMSDVLWVINKDFNIEFINAMATKILGYLPDEMIGKNIMNFIDKDNHSLMKDMMNGKINFSEIQFIRKESFKVITETKTKLLKDNTGNIMGLQGISRDVTEYHNARNQILERNREILAITDVTHLLTRDLDSNDMLYSICYKIATIIKSPLCTIRTLNTKTGKLELIISAGELMNKPLYKEISMTHDINMKLFQTKEIVSIDIEKFPFKESIMPILREYNIKSVISVPLIIKDNTIGIINILSTSSISRNLSLLKSIAGNVSIAIENARLYDNLRKWYMNTIEALAYAVEAKDKYTKGHSLRVSNYAALIGKNMGLSKDLIEKIKIAGILHDIGKIGISDSILMKPGKLTEKEYDIIKQHPEISKKIIEPIGLSRDIIDGIEKHHERYDGKGYPFGLNDDKIPIVAAILSVADSLDAMTSDRSYRKGMPLDDAMNELLENKGTQFNPYVVDSVISIYMNDKHTIESVKMGISYIN